MHSPLPPAPFRTILLGLLIALGGLALACGGSDGEPTAPALTAEEQVVADLGLAGSAFPVALAKPDFVLTNAATGAPYDFRAETAGQVTLLYFGYTNCPDVCPVHMANIAAALDQAPFEVRDAVRVVFVGVDAPRDSAERVRDWLDFFDRDFIGLTGTEEELAAAQTAAQVPVAFIDSEFDGGYTVAHAGWIFLYTRDNLAHLRYPSGIRQAAWAHDLELLTTEGWPS
ncbi:MAG: SCO family protein [Chloroflexi bacterium]|nr:SCO family protein [Chloroflexota bacterium]MDA1146312.1 SCO family protein [Chloroflexota bacterium]